MKLIKLKLLKKRKTGGSRRSGRSASVTSDPTSVVEATVPAVEPSLPNVPANEPNEPNPPNPPDVPPASNVPDVPSSPAANSKAIKKKKSSKKLSMKNTEKNSSGGTIIPADSQMKKKKKKKKKSKKQLIKSEKKTKEVTDGEEDTDKKLEDAAAAGAAEEQDGPSMELLRSVAAAAAAAGVAAATDELMNEAADGSKTEEPTSDEPTAVALEGAPKGKTLKKSKKSKKGKQVKDGKGKFNAVKGMKKKRSTSSSPIKSSDKKADHDPKSSKEPSRKSPTGDKIKKNPKKVSIDPASPVNDGVKHMASPKSPSSLASPKSINTAKVDNRDKKKKTKGRNSPNKVSSIKKKKTRMKEVSIKEEDDELLIVDDDDTDDGLQKALEAAEKSRTMWAELGMCCVMGNVSSSSTAAQGNSSAAADDDTDFVFDNAKTEEGLWSIFPWAWNNKEMMDDDAFTTSANSIVADMKKRLGVSKDDTEDDRRVSRSNSGKSEYSKYDTSYEDGGTYEDDDTYGDNTADGTSYDDTTYDGTLDNTVDDSTAFGNTLDRAAEDCYSSEGDGNCDSASFPSTMGSSQRWSRSSGSVGGGGSYEEYTVADTEADSATLGSETVGSRTVGTYKAHVRKMRKPDEENNSKGKPGKPPVNEDGQKKDGETVPSAILTPAVPPTQHASKNNDGASPAATKRGQTPTSKVEKKTKGSAGKVTAKAGKKTQKSPKSTPTSNKMHVRMDSKSEKRTRGRTPSPREIDEKPAALDKKSKSTPSFKDEHSSSKELKRDESLPNMENEKTSISLSKSDTKPEGHLQSDAALTGKTDKKKQAEKKLRSTSKSPMLNIKSHARSKSASPIMDVMRTLTQSKTSSVSCYSQDPMSSSQTGSATKKEGTSNNSTNESQASHSPTSVNVADSQTHNVNLNAVRPVSPPLKKRASSILLKIHARDTLSHTHMPDMRSVGKTIMSASRTVKSAPVLHGHRNKGGVDRLRSISPGIFDKLLAKAKHPTAAPVEEAPSADANISPSPRIVPHGAEGSEEPQGLAEVEPADAALTENHAVQKEKLLETEQREQLQREPKCNTIKTTEQKTYQNKGRMSAEFAFPCVEDEGRDERESTSRLSESALEFPSVMSSETQDDNTEGSVCTDDLMNQAHELLNLGISEM